MCRPAAKKRVIRRGVTTRERRVIISFERYLAVDGQQYRVAVVVATMTDTARREKKR